MASLDHSPQTCVHLAIRHLLSLYRSAPAPAALRWPTACGLQQKVRSVLHKLGLGLSSCHLLERLPTRFNIVYDTSLTVLYMVLRAGAQSCTAEPARP